MTVEKIEDKAYDVLIKITNLNSFRTKKGHLIANLVQIVSVV